jgi:hypothetical protein
VKALKNRLGKLEKIKGRPPTNKELADAIIFILSEGSAGADLSVECKTWIKKQPVYPPFKAKTNEELVKIMMNEIEGLPHEFATD